MTRIERKSRGILTGTTVIGIKTFHEVILAADTKLSKVADKQTSDAGRIRKIAAVGGLFFAAAGLYGGPQSTFNLGLLMTNAGEGNPPIAEKVERFAAAVRQPLIELVLNIKTDHPDYFRSELDNKWVLQIALGAFESGHPHLHRVGCKSIDDGKSLEVRTDQAGIMELVLLGQCSEIEKVVTANNRNGLFASGWRQSIERLIGLEANRYPEKVALPVDIICISMTGASWL